MARRRSDAEPSRELKGIQRTQLRTLPKWKNACRCRPKWKRRPRLLPQASDVSEARLATIHVAFAGKLNQPRRPWRSGQCKRDQAALGNPSVKSRCSRWLT